MANLASGASAGFCLLIARDLDYLAALCQHSPAANHIAYPGVGATLELLGSCMQLRNRRLSTPWHIVLQSVLSACPFVGGMYWNIEVHKNQIKKWYIQNVQEINYNASSFRFLLPKIISRS